MSCCAAWGTDGLIPARAGKTRSPVAVAKSLAAHPRACGENATLAPIFSLMSGSSPRVRGKPLDKFVHFGNAGLIPARAGKTCPLVGGIFIVSAHPRACGENICLYAF